MAEKKFPRNGKPDGKPGRPQKCPQCDGLEGLDWQICVRECLAAICEARKLAGQSCCDCSHEIRVESNS